MSFRQNTISGPETCQIGPKVVIWSCPDLPRPVQEDKYLLQTSGNTFFLDFTPLHFLLASLSFYKIISFIKQSFETNNLKILTPILKKQKKQT